VTAVQSVGEVAELSSIYAGVEFIETEMTGTAFGRPKCVRLSAAIETAKSSPVLLVNSDIYFSMTAESLEREWGLCDEKQLKVGIRWDVFPNGKKQPFKWGIDVFLITPEIAKITPDIGMTIGCPVWDYWLPWFLMQNGFSLSTNLGIGFMHKVHPQNWSKEEYKMGFEIVRENHGISEKFLTNFIQKETGRRSLRG
jgi:hypothetical protein